VAGLPECETRCGNTRAALHLIAHAEDVLPAGSENASPAWMDWFSPVRLAAFKGNTQLAAGHLPQARSTLLQVLDELPPEADKQRSVVLGDLAAVEAAAERPEEACEYAFRALDQLAATWYATGIQPWQNRTCVRDLRRPALRVGDDRQRSVALSFAICSGSSARESTRSVASR
jgi:hypothetical protein